MSTAFLALPATAAFANHTTVTNVTVNAPATASAGTCVPVTVTVTGADANGAGTTTPAENTRIDVVLTEGDADAVTPGVQPSATEDVDFCTTATGTTTPQTGQNGTDTGAAGNTDRAEFITGTDGTFTFGVITNETGVVDIAAFFDADNNNERSALEPQGNDAITFTSGGAAGAQGTANNVNCVDATPETDTNFVGERHVINVRLTNNETTPGTPGANVANSMAAACAGDTVAGVTPTAVLTGENSNAPAATITCDASDNSGVSRCSYVGARAGADTITVFVNQTDANSTAGQDGTEPSDTVSKTFVAAPTGLQVDLTCAEGATAPNTSAENCVKTAGTGTGTQAFVATVTTVDGGDAGTDRDPVAGVVVRFTENGTDATIVTGTAAGTAGNGGVATDDTAECVTDVNGQCTATLTENTPRAGEVITVTATIRGQNATGDNAQDSTSATGELSSDSGTVTFVNSPGSARFIVLTPDTAITTAGQFQTFTARVTDVNGDPVQGVTVTFSEDGVGRFANGTSSQPIVTDANGQARIEVTSTANESGNQTITASISSAATQCGVAANTGGTATTPRPNAGNCTDSSTNTFRAPVTPGPDTGNPNPNPNPSDTAVARITLNVTSGRITAGNAPFLFGIVTDRNGSPLRNRDVTILQKRYNTTSFQELQTATDITTNERGEFRIRVQPDQQTAYVARATGTSVQSDAAGSTGRAVIVQVHNRINLATPVANQSASGRALQVRGDLDPNYASVRIGVAALRNGRFTYLTQGITAGDGSFVINVRNLPQGTFALVVYTSARQGNLFGSASRSVTAS